jgi:ABC-type branched-subunit amino acid transport system permease subunit
VWGRILFAGTIIALLLLPLVADVYILYLASVTAVYLIIALSLNLLLGYAGQISLGHAGFAAVGAYASAVLMKQTGLSFGVTAFFGACLAALVGLLVGLPALKVRGYYLALVTLAFGEIIQVILRQAKPITGGNDGLAVVAPQVPGLALTRPQTTYYLLWAVAAISLLLVRNIVRGRSGRAFACMRDSEVAAQAVGISLPRYKLYAFVISAFLAGLAGAMYSILNQYIHPDDFDFGRSIAYLMMVVVGGLGTLAGSVIGAVLLAVLPEVLRRLQDYQELVFGMLLLGSIIFAPQGVVGLTRYLVRRGTA